VDRDIAARCPRGLCDDAGVTPGDRLQAIEERYLAARDARDRLDVARALGELVDIDTLEAQAHSASSDVHALLSAFHPGDAATLLDDDRRALATMRAGIDAADDYRLPVSPAMPPGTCDDPSAWREVQARGDHALGDWLEACYATKAAGLRVGDETLTRLGVLARLGGEPDRGRRQALFLALEPLWRVMAGNDGRESPYRALLDSVASSWRAGHSSTARNAAALGVTRDEVETWALAALAAWRAAVVEPGRAAGEPPVEPWDWWWRAGAAERIIGPVSLAQAEAVNRDVYASLGADLDALGVRFDIRPRPGRPQVPVAFTTFGSRPYRREDGSWSAAQPIVVASCAGGGLADLGELLHETGHAIHIAAIRTRPAFADWPDSDALTEAMGELVAFDIAEPDWQRRWLPGRPEVPEALAIRCHYASAVLDAAWTLFEIRLLETPDLNPDEAWTELTTTWLGIAPHPEWSWWAIRGQLVQEPGYMANYAIGSVLAAALRAAIREARGPWIDGDPGWYPWVRDQLYRFGLERPSGDVVRRVLGRAPKADALLGEIARAARAH
jgi:hypothetical protein